MDKEKNWNKIVEELKSTGRKGIPEFLKWLETTDFKSAPASTKYHLCVEAGLSQHSLDVLKFARILTKETGLDIPSDSLIICSLLHDVCKVNYYIKGWEWNKQIKETENRWEKMDVWKVLDAIPWGHGEKSALLCNKYIDLKTDEISAIRWHMGWSDSGVHENYPSGFPFRESLDRYPLLKIIMMADSMAELYETINNS